MSNESDKKKLMAAMVKVSYHIDDGKGKTIRIPIASMDGAVVNVASFSVLSYAKTALKKACLMYPDARIMVTTVAPLVKGA